METMKLNLEIPASLVLPLADRLKAYSALDGIITSGLATTGEEPKPAADPCPIRPGRHFTYNGVEFVALGMEQGGVLAVSAHAGEKMPFDKDGSNDWRESSLRKFLNGDYLDCFDTADLLPFVSDLTSDDGMTDYGKSEDYIFLLSCDLYRKYRPFMPKYDKWTWTLTPWTCSPSDASGVRYVYTDGTLSNYYASNADAAAPACLFNPESIKSAMISAGEGTAFKFV